MALPNHFKQQVLDAFLGGETIKVGLLDNSSSYSFSPDNDEFVSDLPTTQEPSDASYSRVTLSGLSFSQDNSSDEGVFDADDVTFSSLSTTNDIQAVFVYRQVGADDSTPADDELVAVYDDNSAGSLADLPIATNGSDLTLSFNADGIVNIS